MAPNQSHKKAAGGVSEKSAIGYRRCRALQLVGVTAARHHEIEPSLRPVLRSTTSRCPLATECINLRISLAKLLWMVREELSR